jgi:hypothetical protein
MQSTGDPGQKWDQLRRASHQLSAFFLSLSFSFTDDHEGQLCIFSSSLSTRRSEMESRPKYSIQERKRAGVVEYFRIVFYQKTEINQKKIIPNGFFQKDFWGTN